jgi:hypothetical protein
VLEQSVDNPDQRMTSDVRQGKNCICGNFFAFLVTSGKFKGYGMDTGTLLAAYEL